MARARQLVDAGVDALVVDSAHGHSTGVLDTVSELREAFPDAQIVAGNVATFDGAKAMVNSRSMQNCHNEFATFVHGTKCAAQFSGNVHTPTVHTYKNQRTAKDNIAWRPEKEKVSPYQVEWDMLLSAIRQDRPHNEARRAAFANLASIMGRAAIHSGKIITWEQMLASDFMFCPNVADFTYDSPSPLQADAQSRYPVPVPGKWTEI